MGVVDGANMRLSLHTEVLKWPLAHNESMMMLRSWIFGLFPDVVTNVKFSHSPLSF